MWLSLGFLFMGTGRGRENNLWESRCPCVFQEAMKMTLKWLFFKKLHWLNHKNAFPAQETRPSNAWVEPTSNWVGTQRVSSAQRYRVTLTASLRCQDFYHEDRTRVLKSVLPTYFESEILVQVLQGLLFKSYIGGAERKKPTHKKI